MKKCFRPLIAAAVTAALLGCGGALAAGESAVTVQLDGQAMTFTDALPQVKDQRTFLPFRAVFEAMGAQVDNEGSVITATRDGRTLTMTLNETAATVTEGGVTTTITMDVAPYVDNATWRTYVPVRFAAQAFDCSVGWDQANSTAIIVDTDKLVASALEGKSFTYLEKLADFSKKYNEGIWDMEASFEANMGMEGLSVPMSGSVKGTMEGGEKLSMEFGLMEPISLRGDLGKGVLYMNGKGEDWYRLDMAALSAQAGMDWTGMMGTKSLNCAALVKWALSSLTLSDSATAYTQVKERVEEVVSNLSDEGFVREDDRYTAAVAFEEDNTFTSLILVVEMKEDTVTGYVMSEAGETVTDGVTASTDMTVSVDDKDRMTSEMHMDLAGELSMEMTMAGGYTPGKTAPVTEPPAGARVADFMGLAGQTAPGA